MYPIRTIVAGIASDQAPDPVLDAAVELAARAGAALHLVQAFELPSLVWDAYARMGMMEPAALEGVAAGLRGRLEARVAELAPEIPVRVETVAAPPAPTILAAAARESASLVVVGATRRGPLARAILGTTAQRVLRQAEVPVMVLRERLADPLERVVLATDLSQFSASVHEAGLDVIESLAGADRPELRLLHVAWHGVELPPPVRQEILDDLANNTLDRFLRERRPRANPPVAAVRYGEPAHEIAAEVAEWRADLLVVGSHGRSAVVQWMLGSVAESAIRDARSSVLVIPAARGEAADAAPPIASDAR